LPQPEKSTENFDQLYRDNYVKVFRMALFLTNRERSTNIANRFSDAEDITQEAFLRAFRSYHTFREDSSFFTWIYRIAVNVANDYMRQRTKLPIYEVADMLGCSEAELADPNPANDPESKLMVNEVMRGCMLGFTECLPVNQKKIFFLVIGLGLPYKVAAEILDCSVGSLKTTLHRAKDRLLGYMEGRCSLIKKSNSCRCEQWVKAGLSHGWITKESITNPLPKITIPDKEKIYMRDVHDIYRNVYLAQNDELLAELIKKRFTQKKWSFRDL